MELKEETRMWKRGKILGKGGFGSVFLATNSGVSSSLPPLLAVKSVQITQGNVSPATSLLEERYILSHLPPSPHIIGFYGEEVSLDQGQFYFNLLLEYACLGSLGDRIRETTTGLPEPQVQHYTRPILAGLQHIHLHNFVHCDIKPDNILLVLDNSSPPLPIPKIADFGLAKFAGEPLDVVDTTHHLRGTALYMAPESIRYSQFEPPCDVWSLGCVVLQMLTGKSVWDCNKDPSLRHLLRRIGYTDELPVIPSTVSSEAQDFLRKCLVKDASLRWTPEMLLQHPFLATQNPLPPLSQVLDLDNLSERIDYISGDDIGTGCFTSPTCSATFFPCNSFIPLKVEDKIEVSAHGLSYISLEVTNNTEKQMRKRTFDKIGDIPSKGGKRRKTPHEVHEVTDRPPYVLPDTTYKYRPWTTEAHPLKFISAIV